jgi:hypothetical protein
VSYFNNGEYLLVGGSDRKVTLMTKEGVKIMEVRPARPPRRCRCCR